MVLGLALGVGLWSTANTTVEAQGRNPLGKGGSRNLYHIELHPQDPLPRTPELDRYWAIANAPHLMVPYRYIAALEAAQLPIRLAPTFSASLAVTPDPAATTDAAAHFTSSNLFGMFGMRFRFGGGWSPDQDQGAQPVVVLDHELNQAWFGGRNSVGRTLRIGAHELRIVGVLAPDPTRVRLFDFPFDFVPSLYLPFYLFQTLEVRPDFVCPASTHGGSFAELLASDDTWIHVWAALPTPADRGALVAA